MCRRFGSELSLSRGTRAMRQKPQTRLELEKAAKLARELSEAARLEEMKRPHPQQAEIDAASVELLRQSSKFTQEE